MLNKQNSIVCGVPSIWRIPGTTRTAAGRGTTTKGTKREGCVTTAKRKTTNL